MPPRSLPQFFACGGALVGTTVNALVFLACKRGELCHRDSLMPFSGSGSERP
jgi:hypothetical protein